MPLSTRALEPLLRLALVPGVGAQRLARLMERFGSPERALAAAPRELDALPGMGLDLPTRIREAAGALGRRRTERALRRLARSGAVAFTPDDLLYPEAFRALPDPPFLLFAAGDLSLLSAPAVAVVGTRRPSAAGSAAAAELSSGIASAGYAVVSGMARGIDTLAHRAALDADGATIGVLGHGIDGAYPPENRALFRAVAERGLLLTEFPPGERPLAGNFPRRNRLIAALSRAVLVVEMGLKSGAQHTVTYALELGREVMAVPGAIGAAASEGTNQLIKDGARVVTGVQDVLEELGGVGTGPMTRPRDAPPRPRPQPSLALVDDDEARVLAALQPEPRDVDSLAAAASLAPAPLLSLLLELELRGLVEALPGRRYGRTR